MSLKKDISIFFFIYIILFVLVVVYSVAGMAEECKYGTTVMDSKSIIDIMKNGSDIQKKLLVQPWVQCHYKGHSVSCEEYERLIKQDQTKDLDPNLINP